MVNEGMLNEQIKSEREFLHDLSSPLMIAMGMVDAARDKLDPSQSEADEKLEKAKNALRRLTDKVNERRQELKILAKDL